MTATLRTTVLLEFLGIYMEDTSSTVDAVLQQCRYSLGIPPTHDLTDENLMSWLQDRVIRHHPSMGPPTDRRDTRAQHLQVMQGFADGTHEDG